MKFILFLSLCLIFNAPGAAQETCGLKLEDAPTLLGLRLGMSPPEAQSVFGRDLKIKIKKEGTFFQNFIAKPPPASLGGVRALYLRFFNRRLYQIEVFYKDRPDWQTLEQFTNDLSAKSNLNAPAWQNVRARNILTCGEFTLAADKILNPRAELTDEAGRAEFLEAQEREKKKSEKKKAEKKGN